MKLGAFLSAVVLCISTLPLLANEDGGYQLQRGDVVRFSVLGLPALDTQAALDIDGRISLPLIGFVSAANTSIADLTRLVATRMDGRIYREFNANGLEVVHSIRREDVHLSVAAYRPVAVYGSVTSPGEVPFRAGMTVRSALAVTGYSGDQLMGADSSTAFRAAEVRSELRGLEQRRDHLVRVARRLEEELVLLRREALSPREPEAAPVQAEPLQETPHETGPKVLDQTDELIGHEVDAEFAPELPSVPPGEAPAPVRRADSSVAEATQAKAVRNPATAPPRPEALDTTVSETSAVSLRGDRYPALARAGVLDTTDQSRQLGLLQQALHIRRQHLNESLAGLQESMEILEEREQAEAEALEVDKAEVKRIDDLLERGFVNKDRVGDARRNQLISAQRLLQTQDSIARTRLTRIQLQQNLSERASEQLMAVSNELTQTRLEASVLETKMRGLREQLLSLGVAVETREQDIVITLHRDTGSGPESFAVEMDDILYPGDIIEVAWRKQ